MDNSKINILGTRVTTNVLLLFIAAALVGNLVMQIAQSNHLATEKAARAAHAATLADLRAESADIAKISRGIFDEYSEQAYGPITDRISEQQLLAAEYLIKQMQNISAQMDILTEMWAIRIAE